MGPSIGSPFARDFSRYLFVTLSWIPVAIFFNDHVLEITPIRGQSMYPYFNDRPNETRWLDKCLTIKFNVQENLQRGMIVTFL